MKLKKVIPLLVILVGAIIFIFFANKKENKLESNHLYTTCRVNRHMYMSSGERIYYNYSYKGMEYTSSYIDYQLEKTVGNRYFVMFSPENPNVSKILLNTDVPKNFKNPPLNGWKKLPKLKTLTD